MVKGLYTAYTGLLNEQRRLDVISNNIANSDTTGYKKMGVTSQSFDREMAIRVDDDSDPYLAKAIGNVSLGVKIGETYTDYSQGSFREAGATYDLVLEGNGFLPLAQQTRVEQSIYAIHGMALSRLPGTVILLQRMEIMCWVPTTGGFRFREQQQRR